MTATRVDLAEALAKAMKISTPEAKGFVDLFFAQISSVLNEIGDRVVIKNFGRFEVVATKARPVRNVVTGEALMLEKGQRIKFTPSDNFKLRVKQG